MKKYYLITTIASVLLFLMLFIHIKVLHSNYVNDYHNDIEETIYTCIDNELTMRFNKENAPGKEIKKVGFQYISLYDMSPEMRDSILKIMPQPKMPPPVHDVDALRAKGLIRSAYDIVHQNSQDSYIRKGQFIDVKVLDSIFMAINRMNYRTKFVLYNDKGTLIAQSAQSHDDLQDDYKYVSRPFPIGLKGNQSLQLYYNVPLAGFLQLAIWTLPVSFLIICIAVALIIVQLHTIRRKQQRLERINRTINGTIHDLKSPLAGAVMTLDLVNSVVGEKEIKNVICHSQTSIRHLISNIESLLSTAEGNFMDLVLHKTSLSSDALLNIVGCVTADLQILYQNKAHTVSVENTLTTCFQIDLDIVRIESIVRNLIENSIKYSDNGVEISVQLKQDDDNLVINIIDTGWGIAHKYQKQIFKQFYRVPEKKDLQRGYGIGLSQVSLIVKAHNGVIMLNSEDGKGSCFTLKIPVR